MPLFPYFPWRAGTVTSHSEGPFHRPEYSAPVSRQRVPELLGGIVALSMSLPQALQSWLIKKMNKRSQNCPAFPERAQRALPLGFAKLVSILAETHGALLGAHAVWVFPCQQKVCTPRSHQRCADVFRPNDSLTMHIMPLNFAGNRTFVCNKKTLF